ncbi:outer membrane protein assembly factor BamB family protein [Sunxiuqinia sp. A32]|uniref:outer membrane protein assembly factor BamB family protein n=1 Tax=Sunxiuqinia sp. A32 TaxID=3461496 RepID=UPI004045F01D
MKIKILLLIILILPSMMQAQIAQFRGPNRDGKFPSTNLLKEWPAEGPELLIQVDSLGKGFSSVIGTEKYIYVTGMIDTLDYITCIDYSGNKKWQVPYGESWKKSFPDTRSTPTIENDRIYIISGIGELVCLNAETGEINWKQNVDKDYHADWHIWGVSESPLIVDDKVICTPAGTETSVVAFNKITGEEVWESECIEGQRSYASPTLYEYQGNQYILAVTASHLLALNPDDGEIKMVYKYFNPDVWKYQPKGMIWTNVPVYKGDQIFLTLGYDYPAKMVKVNSDATGFEEVYTDTIFDNHHHGVIELDGYIYGSNWENNRKGSWLCKNWETGEIMYNSEWNTKGAIIYADGMLYCFEEKSGNVGLVKPDPKGFEVVSSFQMKEGSGPYWSHPYIYNGKLFLRHGEVMQVYNISAEN